MRPRNANFIVNKGGANSEEILEIIKFGKILLILQQQKCAKLSFRISYFVLFIKL